MFCFISNLVFYVFPESGPNVFNTNEGLYLLFSLICFVLFYIYCWFKVKCVHTIKDFCILVYISSYDGVFFFFLVFSISSPFGCMERKKLLTQLHLLFKVTLAPSIERNRKRKMIELTVLIWSLMLCFHFPFPGKFACFMFLSVFLALTTFL